MKNNKILFLISLAALLVFAGCKKRTADYFVVPPPESNFANNTTGSFYVQNVNNSIFKIPIGITNVATTDRKVTVSVSSSTGATAGTQYNLPSTTVTIPAGKALDSLSVQGLFGGFAGTRIDTLTFKITGGDVIPSAYNSTYKLVLKKYCDVISANLTGNYANSTDTYNGAASSKPNYTSSISNWTVVSPKSATIIIKNLGATSDNGWGPFAATDASVNPGLTATLDWSNPANFTVTIPTQNYFNDGTGNSTITATGTFSSCDQIFTITAKVKYAGNGNTYTHVSYLRR